MDVRQKHALHSCTLIQIWHKVCSKSSNGTGFVLWPFSCVIISVTMSENGKRVSVQILPVVADVNVILNTSVALHYLPVDDFDPFPLWWLIVQSLPQGLCCSLAVVFPAALEFDVIQIIKVVRPEILWCWKVFGWSTSCKELVKRQGPHRKDQMKQKKSLNTTPNWPL